MMWQNPTNLNDYDRKLITLHQPRSIATEQYNILRTELLKIKAKESRNVFLVTSAVRGEGKTLTSANLAITIAKGVLETVLLIDCDLRRPNINSRQSLSDSYEGLSNYLDSEEDIGRFLIKQSICKLTILPSGKIPSNPAELLGSERMIDLIKEVKHRYNNRFIIIDSPPLLPVTDATLLSPHVDGVILVIRASETPKEIVEEGIRKLGKEVNVVGVVLNGIESTPSRRYYRYKYNYY
ncbi:MAG: polysaccharide biosynthesis tyrosine autokinase [bacterium]